MIEIYPGEGGADAEQFASQLANAIASYAGTSVEIDGKVLRLHRL